MCDDGAAILQHIVLRNLFYIAHVVKQLKRVLRLNQLLPFQDPVLSDACIPSSLKFCICHLLIDCSIYKV